MCMAKTCDESIENNLRRVVFICCAFKSTEEDHMDYIHLTAAVQAMTEVAVAINEFKRRKDLGWSCLDFRSL